MSKHRSSGKDTIFAAGVKRVRVSMDRPFSAHNLLIHNAALNLKAREASTAGRVHTELAVLVMSALAIEALCNAVGPRIIEDWDDALSPLSKLQVICSALDIAYDEAIEPWSTLRWLCAFRNDIAHAKPESVVIDKTCGPEQADALRNAMPLSKLEKQVTLGNARRAHRAISAARNIFSSALPVEDRMGIGVDGWTSGLHVEPPT
jgi:hypothetical protein